MKKSLVIALVGLSQLGCAVQAEVAIIDYAPKHKEAVVAIAFEDKELFFDRYSILDTMQVDEDQKQNIRAQFDVENKRLMDEVLDDPCKYKKVMVDANGSVLAFVVYYKNREPSVASQRKAFEKRFGEDFSNNLTDEQILNGDPSVKRTEKECSDFAELECLAVSRRHRRNGYAKQLMCIAQEDCRKKWPHIDRIQLKVNEINAGAQELYESEGFVRSKQQPFEGLMAIHYEKNL